MPKMTKEQKDEVVALKRKVTGIRRKEIARRAGVTERQAKYALECLKKQYRRAESGQL